MKRALVTGGCGFLGGAIVRRLCDRGVAVRVFALPGERTDNVEGLPVELARGDVRRREDLEPALRGVDTVFHCAAVYRAWMPDPSPMYEVNLRGTYHVLEAARRAGVERVVYTASIVALGRPAAGQVSDETSAYEAWDIDFAYSRSKYLSLLAAEDFARWGLDVRVVCPGLVLGPGDVAPTPSGRLILNAVKAAGVPFYFEGGASYVDVRDAAAVHVAAAEHGRSGERYIATAHNLDNLQYLEAIGRVLGRQRRYRKLPVAAARAVVAGLEAVAARTGKEPLLSRAFFEYSLRPAYFSGAKAARELGATYRPIEDTLRDALDDFKARGVS